MLSEQVKKIGTKAVLAGVASAVVGTVYFGNGSVPVMGWNMPVYVPLAGSAAVGSVLSDVSHDYILNHIPKNEKYINIESAALGVAVSGAGSLASLALTLPLAQGSYLPAFAIGAGSYVGADYLMHNVLEDSKTHQLIF